MNKIINLYLDLMKIALTDLNHLEGITDPEILINGKDWPASVDTMIGVRGLNNIEYCISEILKNKIQGDFIETGVWRGGAVIFMQAMLRACSEKGRNVWVADSFEGLPKPNIELYPADKGDMHHTIKFLSVPSETVINNFKKYHLLDKNVKFLKGWFKDTLTTTKIKKLALLRLDGDMYESTMEALVNLYPKLSNGGYIIIDDWGLSRCKRAVEDYREKHNITEKIIKIDGEGVYWKKEKDIKNEESS